eukprot:gene1972-3838_t
MISGVSLASLVTAARSTPGAPTPSNPVTLSHLLPRCASDHERSYLGYTDSDMDNIRNTILLCKGLEEAFAGKNISFVPSDKPFSNNKYKLHIWTDIVKTNPIYEGASADIGSFDGFPLNLEVDNSKFHNPLNRALSYQAFRACKKWNPADLPEGSDNSVYQGGYKTQRRQYADELALAIKKDEDAVEEDNEENKDYPVDEDEDHPADEEFAE